MNIIDPVTIRLANSPGIASIMDRVTMIRFPGIKEPIPITAEGMNLTIDPKTITIICSKRFAETKGITDWIIPDPSAAPTNEDWRRAIMAATAEIDFTAMRKPIEIIRAVVPRIAERLGYEVDWETIDLMERYMDEPILYSELGFKE